MSNPFAMRAYDLPSPKVEDVGYLVREFRNGYQVSKWGERTEPLAIYFVWENSKGWNCSSPGCYRKTSCKHSDLVQSWLSRNHPVEMPDFMMDIKGNSLEQSDES